ncbi:AdoMet-homocysteine methyltransferase [Scheffersomyces amazonensis]|uniref:AdoMet-homocysteine methyltransferase n=1 Tax=Scheffersomyces amazonensis TaxID=1078765 RepID=UPI00315D1986
MSDLRDILKAKRLVLDGALGTELERIIPKNDEYQPRRNPLWSGQVLLNKPELVELVHQSYLDISDVDMLITSTYQTSYQSLQKFGRLNNTEITDLWARSVAVIESAIAKSSTNRKIYVVGSIGPYATLLCDGSEYTGDYKQDDNNKLEDIIVDYYRPLYEYWVKNDRIDVIGFETIPNFTELKSIIKLVKSISPKKLFYISFNFKDDTQLVDGTPINQVLEYIVDQIPYIESQLLAIGLNCIDYRKITAIVTKINKLQGDIFNLIIYPNLGFEYSDDIGEYRANKREDHWIASIKEWLKFANVRVIGGCCSTDPSDIKQVRQLIEE